MTKNNMISGLAVNQITLDLAFNNLLLVANVINNRDLLRWVEHEIGGYKETDIIPVYRRDEKSTQFMYSMVNNGYTTTNLPLPFSYFPDDVQGEVIYFDILEAIKTIEKMLHSKEPWFLTRDCTIYAPDIYKKSGIPCLNIYQILSKNSYERFYSSAKLNLTKVLLLIERWFGTLDSAEMQSKKYDKFKVAEANKEITNYINSLFTPTQRLKTKEVKKPANEQHDISLQQKTPQSQPQQPAQQVQPQPMQQVPQQPVQPIQQIPQTVMPPVIQPVMPQQPVQPIQQMPQSVMPPVMPQRPMQQMMQQMPPQYYTAVPAQPIAPQMQRQTAPANQAPIISNEQQYAETVLPSSFQTEANYNDDFKKSEEPAIEEKPKETKPTEVQKELKEEEKEPVKQKEEDVSQPEEPKMESKRQDDTEEPIKFIRETKVVVVKEPDEEVLQAAKKELPDKEPEKKAEEHLESSPEPKEIIENKENKENKDKPVQSGIFARISGLKK